MVSYPHAPTKADTVVTQDQVLTGDVGNLKEANEALSSKSEELHAARGTNECNLPKEHTCDVPKPR
eukprot:317058-Amphidinium_carterae.4